MLILWVDESMTGLPASITINEEGLLPDWQLNSRVTAIGTK